MAQPDRSPAPPSASQALPSIGADRLAPSIHEDWTRLPVDTSIYDLLEPALGGEDGNDKFSREFLQLQWRPGDPVEVYVIRPKGVAKAPVMLYLYGYNENLDRFKNDRFCERITAGGYAAVGFEPALGVDRFRNRPMKQWFVSQLQESLGSSVHDVQMVLNYLESRKDLDMDRAGIFGQGPGGAIAILSSAADARLKVVDTLNPWGDWSDWLAKSSVIPDAERSSFLAPEFMEKVKPLEPADWLPKVKASSLRLQFVGGNPAVPEAVIDRLAAAAQETHSDRYTVTHYKDAQDLIQKTEGGKLYDWSKDRLRSKAAHPEMKPAESTAAPVKK